MGRSTLRFSQNVAGGEALAVGEGFGGDSVAAFELDFDQLQGAFTTDGAQWMEEQPARFARRWPCHARFPDMQLPAAKTRVGSGPRLESAHAVVDGLRRLTPVDEAVLFIPQRRICGLGGILLLGRDDGDVSQGFYKKPGSHGCQARP